MSRRSTVWASTRWWLREAVALSHHQLSAYRRVQVVVLLELHISARGSSLEDSQANFASVLIHPPQFADRENTFDHLSLDHSLLIQPWRDGKDIDSNSS